MQGERAARWVALLVPLVAGCPSPQPCFFGDEGAPPEMDVGMRGTRGVFIDVNDGDPVDLTFPVQGGHVLFVAARLRNMNGCRVDFSARLVDPDTGELGSEEERRQIDFTVDGGNGVIPDLSDTANTANVPVCPNTFGSKDRVDVPWNLEVVARDEQGREARAVRRVVPMCRQPGPYSRAACVCECKAGYYLGKCSLSGDGGVDGGADGG